MAIHYLNQCCNYVNWTPRNTLQWYFNRHSDIFIEENTFEKVFCVMSSISSQPQCVNCVMYAPMPHRIIRSYLFLLGFSPSHYDSVSIDSQCTDICVAENFSNGNGKFQPSHLAYFELQDLLLQQLGVIQLWCKFRHHEGFFRNL